MTEKIKNSLENSANSANELEQAGAEQLTRIKNTLEEQSTNLEKSDDNGEKEDSARQEALEVAHSSEKQDSEKAQKESEKQPVDNLLTRDVVNARYQETLEGMRSRLPSKASQAFSKVIHNPIVDKTSEVIGDTVARPNLVVAGAIGAITSVVVYFIARRYGYPLSGSETIGLFIAGWMIGAIIEFARAGFLNKK